jgi:hypothetical protein
MSRGGTTYLFDGIFGGTINVTIFTASKKVSFLLRHCSFTRVLLSNGRCCRCCRRCYSCDAVFVIICLGVRTFRSENPPLTLHSANPFEMRN